MPKTSSKSVSKAAPKKKKTVTTKSRAVTKKPVAKKKSTSTKKRSTTKSSKLGVNTKVTKTAMTAKAALKIKKPVKKTKSVAEAPKKTPEKKVAKVSISKKSLPAREPVILPTRMSIRAREKALVLAKVFEKDFYVPGLTLARFGGFCFIIIGGIATMSQLDMLVPNQACGIDNCQVAQASSVLDGAVQNIAEPGYLELLTDLPSTVTVKTNLPLEITSVVEVFARLSFISSDGSQQIPIPVRTIGNNKYEVSIDPANLQSFDYELLVTVVHKDRIKPVLYSLGYFAVTHNSNINTEVLMDLLDEVEPVDTNNVDNTDSQILSELDQDAFGVSFVESDSTREQVVPDQKPRTTIDNAKAQIVETEKSASQNIRITTNPVAIGVTTVRLEEIVKGGQTFFYLRKVQGLHTQRIGILISGRDRFTFDSRLYPNGQYQLYAETTVGGKKIVSNNADLVITNQIAKLETSVVSSTTQRELVTIKDALVTQPTTKERQSESEILRNQTDANSVVFDPTASLNNRVVTLFNTDSEKLNILLQNYAAAQQSGDELLIAEAERAIRLYKEGVISAALADPRDRSIAKELDESLQQELTKLQQKVRTFEKVRQERSDIESSVDTDGDGISDFDEVNLYRTNPQLADTDGDGFTDGVEIMRGFDPTNALIEAVMTYQSPKDVVGVVTTNTLQVLQVEPKVIVASSNEPESVQAVVRGRGLPNSFVTLYIFSTPTIVTVRTEADGTFEYTFSKELEDGEHQVFVALTDNTGAIVAQSEPFTFIKEAQAFTPVDAQEMMASDNTTDFNSITSPYRLVLGMSVLALGVLLILLGVGLRGNRPEIIITEKELA